LNLEISAAPDAVGGALAVRSGDLTRRRHAADSSRRQRERRQEIVLALERDFGGAQIVARLGRHHIRVQSQSQLLNVERGGFLASLSHSQNDVAILADRASFRDWLAGDFLAIDHQGQATAAIHKTDLVIFVIKQTAQPSECDRLHLALPVEIHILDGSLLSIQTNASLSSAIFALKAEQIPGISQRLATHLKKPANAVFGGKSQTKHAGGGNSQLTASADAVRGRASIGTGDLRRDGDSGNSLLRKRERRQEIVFISERNVGTIQILASIYFASIRISVKPQRLNVDFDGSRGTVLLRRHDISADVDGAESAGALRLHGHAVDVQRDLVALHGDLDLVEAAVEQSADASREGAGLQVSSAVAVEDRERLLRLVGAVDVDAELRLADFALDADEVPTVSSSVLVVHADDALEGEALWRKSA